MQNITYLNHIDPAVISKNWYLRYGFNLPNIMKNNFHAVKDKEVLFSLGRAFKLPLLSVIQGFLLQCNYQDKQSYLNKEGACNVVTNVEQLSPNLIYLNRRVTQDGKGRAGFQEIVIDRQKRRVDTFFRKLGCREVYEHESIEEGEHSIFGINESDQQNAPQDCWSKFKRPLSQIIMSDDDDKKARFLAKKMAEQSEDGACRTIKSGETQLKVPIMKVQRGVSAVKYGLDVYIHLMPYKDRIKWFDVYSNYLAQQVDDFRQQQKDNEE